MSIFDRIIDQQLHAILPGGSGWPPYSRSASALFWNNWHSCAPFSTRLALRGGSLLVAAYCFLLRQTRRDCFTLERQLETGLNSHNYLIAQSVLFLKLIASMAYFSDPEMQTLGRAREPQS